jgi:hypothetical protein
MAPSLSLRIFQSGNSMAFRQHKPHLIGTLESMFCRFASITMLDMGDMTNMNRGRILHRTSTPILRNKVDSTSILPHGLGIHHRVLQRTHNLDQTTCCLYKWITKRNHASTQKSVSVSFMRTTCKSEQHTHTSDLLCTAFHCKLHVPDRCSATTKHAYCLSFRNCCRSNRKGRSKVASRTVLLPRVHNLHFVMNACGHNRSCLCA